MLAPNTSLANEQPEGEKLLLVPHSKRHVTAISTSPQVYKHPSPWTPNWYEDWASAYSSDNKSCKSLFRSRKQPNECMLSNTSGSISSKEGRERICTFRGIGCSGSGSFLPPLQKKEDEREKGGRERRREKKHESQMNPYSETQPADGNSLLNSHWETRASNQTDILFGRNCHEG